MLRGAVAGLMSGAPRRSRTEEARPRSDAPWPTAFTESIGGALLADLLRWKLGQPRLTWPVEFRTAEGTVVTSPGAMDWQGFSELDARMAEVARTGDIVRKMAGALRAPAPPQR